MVMSFRVQNTEVSGLIVVCCRSVVICNVFFIFFPTIMQQTLYHIKTIITNRQNDVSLVSYFMWHVWLWPDITGVVKKGLLRDFLWNNMEIWILAYSSFLLPLYWQLSMNVRNKWKVYLSIPKTIHEFIWYIKLQWVL